MNAMWIAGGITGGVALVALILVVVVFNNDQDSSQVGETPGFAGSASGNSRVGGPLAENEAVGEIEAMLRQAMSQRHPGARWKITKWHAPVPKYVGIYVDSKRRYFIGEGRDRAEVEQDMLESHQMRSDLQDADPDDRPRFQKLEQIGLTQVVQYELTKTDGWHYQCEHTFAFGIDYAVKDGQVTKLGGPRVDNRGWHAKFSHPDGGRGEEASYGFP